MQTRDNRYNKSKNQRQHPRNGEKGSHFRRSWPDRGHEHFRRRFATSRKQWRLATHGLPVIDAQWTASSRQNSNFPQADFWRGIASEFAVRRLVKPMAFNGRAWTAAVRTPLLPSTQPTFHHSRKYHICDKTLEYTAAKMTKFIVRALRSSSGKFGQRSGGSAMGQVLSKVLLNTIGRSE